MSGDNVDNRINSAIDNDSDKATLTPEQLLTQLDDTTDYLQDRLEKPYDIMRKEIDALRSVVSNINTLIAVGAFITGVQAEMIAFTRQSNANATQIATNWFAFVGLTLDILATSIGIVRTLTLQRSIRRTERMLHIYSGNVSRLQRHLDRLKQKVHRRNRVSVNDVRNAISQATHHQSVFEKFQRYYDASLPSHQTPNILDDTVRVATIHPPPLAVATSSVDISLQMVQMIRAVADDLPTVAMGSGFMFLLISVMLFAATSQVRQVWLTCVVVAATIIIWAMLPAVVGVRVERRKKRLYDEMAVLAT